MATIKTVSHLKTLLTKKLLLKIQLTPFFFKILNVKLQVSKLFQSVYVAFWKETQKFYAAHSRCQIQFKCCLSRFSAQCISATAM